MTQIKKIPEIKIDTNIENYTVVKVGDVALDGEALMLLDGIQEDLGEHYCNGLRRISDLIIENCDEMPIEYDETVHLLQLLSQLRQDIQTLMWPRNPIADKTGFDMWLGQRSEDDAETVESMELAAANDNPDEGCDGVDDDDSEMQYAGQ